jgi:tetratricopeptide (TPR) repeat protein
MGCFGLGQVYAGGKQEDPLAAADTLIAERKYNEAILLLTQFIKTNPDRFDDAQRRLQRIVKLREEYNAIAGELLNVLVTDPTNDERKLAMIRQLESLEAAPNRAAREFILKTKETALFTYNRAQFEKIMADGRVLIDKGDYLVQPGAIVKDFLYIKRSFTRPVMATL